MLELEAMERIIYKTKKFILGICNCGHCNEDIPIRTKTTRKLQRFKHGHNHAHWNGGRKKTGGYILTLKPEHHFANSAGYVMEHRLVYEEYNKCCLLPTTVIHHK